MFLVIDKLVKITMNHIKTLSISDLPIWDQAKEDRTLLSVVLELTARCNNNCAHCYINLPAGDKDARDKELSFEQIKVIADDAVSLGALWFLISGGEPLLRPDFADIYLYLKKKGLLVSVFTNASLVTEEHIKLFRKYPPRDIEVTVYGVTEKVHKKVTGKNTFAATMAGIDMLLAHNFPVTLKSTIMRSNVDEIDQISEFCRSRSEQSFRFDPFLHLRLDRDPLKNKKIISERLTCDQIFAIEQSDPARMKFLRQKCQDTDVPEASDTIPEKIFRCRAGINSCCIDSNGILKLCTSLCNEKCIYDLKEGSLSHAWDEFVPGVLQMESDTPSYIDTCGTCTMHDICSWCPAHADLETGKLDGHIEYFCNVANVRKNKFAVKVG